MEFVAIDVETANADMASICQIGLAKFRDGKLVGEWSSLVNPKAYFDKINMGIHGIKESDIAEAPTYDEIHAEIVNYISGSICVSHTHFDRVSLLRAALKHSLSPIDSIWLDSAKVARRSWEECRWSGYGLSNVCKLIDYNFKHHDALEDAKASGQVLLAAIEKSGVGLNAWLTKASQPISQSGSTAVKAIAMDGNPNGDMYGEVIVFTGALDIPRKEAAQLAASLGCDVASGVTKKTTLLVVGDQDVSRLAGKTKSSKHLKAESLIEKGQKIRIIKESDFKVLVQQTD